jgi:LysM repeat protein
MKRTLFIATILASFFLLQNLCLAGINFYPENASTRQFSFELNPGESAMGNVIIHNIDEENTTFELYGADGTQTNLGTLALVLKSVEQRHIGAWVKFEESPITLGPDEKITVPFSIEIPQTATPGTYSGGIAAEIIKNNNKSSVSTSARNVIKLFVSIPGDKNHSFDWKSFTYDPKTNNGNPTFNLAYKNTGNTIVTVEQKIVFTGFPPLGENSEMILNTAQLQPGAESSINTLWKNVPFFGFYTATAEITFYEYDIINNLNINPQTQKKEITISIIPTLESVLLLLLIIAAITIYAVRTAIAVKKYKSLVEYRIKSNDTLESIAKKHNTTWEKLARLNKMEKPYSIKQGQIIRVPPIKKK